MKSALKFTNSFTSRLTADPLTPGTPFSPGKAKSSQFPRPVFGAHFSYVLPEKLDDPELILSSKDAFKQCLDWDIDKILSDSDKKRELTGLFAGAELFEGFYRFALFAFW
jgi:hypothetical protein